MGGSIKVDVSIQDVLKDWGQDDLHNLMALLGDNVTRKIVTVKGVEQVIKALFHSKTRAVASSTVSNVSSWVTSKLLSKQAEYVDANDLTKQVPSYSELLLGACEHLELIKEDESIPLEQAELYLSHSIIISALSKMTPKQRIAFFNKQLPIEDIAGNVKGSDNAGSITAIAALGAANASGFGVYMASTTALGFVTHAVGVTLPFAVYTGMASTIAVVIGPLGWLAAGSWGVWQLTEPEWKKIIPALIYITSVNSANQLKSPILSVESPNV